ncbi:MAG: uroporphyrinogen-III synthase [Bacteroidetes bacterium]|nr:uroporphyrinogen-III synthase [Bacteroidota bacterium]MBV6462326.1 hypothetical protein [Flavobacteriales bacterium]WKZ74908.1 MAG: uroporphyrinogen-III synthase [Vicingaceae bacterium]MCL4816132.1 uroporphyrinogen-III synthase [Flavobacteriales bacterium]NOG95291.1 uroporphyrinogen-III synthase [Bacteroidota bacterium]
MKPLQNKRILVTRSAEQSAPFVLLLKKYGAIPVLLPLIKIVPAQNTEEIHQKIAALHSFHQIIFTSSNAVKYFFHFCNQPLPTHIKIACVGKKTSDYLKGIGYSTHFIPENYTAESLLDSITVSANEKILIPQSSLSDDLLYKGLTKKNCQVEKMVVYENVPTAHDKESIEKIFSEKIDFITFTSGSTANNFIMLTKKYNIHYAESKVVCIGMETKIAAEENGITVHAVAFPHTIEGILQAIIKLNRV